MIDLFEIGRENRILSKLYDIDLSSVYDSYMNWITWTIKRSPYDVTFYRIEINDFLNTEYIIYMLDKFIHNQFYGRIIKKEEN